MIIYFKEHINKTSYYDIDVVEEEHILNSRGYFILPTPPYKIQIYSKNLKIIILLIVKI